MAKKSRDPDDLEDDEEDEEIVPVLEDPNYTPESQTPEEKLEGLNDKMPWSTRVCTAVLTSDAPPMDDNRTPIVGHVRTYADRVSVEDIQRNHGGGTYGVRFYGPGKRPNSKVIWGSVSGLVIGGPPFINNVTPPEKEEKSKASGSTEAALLAHLQREREMATARIDEDRQEMKRALAEVNNRRGSGSEEMMAVVREAISRSERDQTATLQRIAEISDRAAENIRQSNENHAREIRELGERHREQIETVRQDYRAQLDSMRDEGARYRQESRESAEARERALRDSAERRERDLRDDFSKREIYLRDQAAREEKLLRERLEEAKEELREYKAQHETLRTNLQNTQFGLAKAEFAAALAESSKKEEGGLEGMVKQIESAKTVMGLVGGGDSGNDIVSQILPILNTEAGKRVAGGLGAGLGAVLGGVGGALSPQQAAQQKAQEAQQQALLQQQALVQQQQEPPTPRRKVRRRVRPAPEQSVETPQAAPEGEAPPASDGAGAPSGDAAGASPATEAEKAQAQAFVTMVQQAADQGMSPEAFIAAATPHLGGPEVLQAIAQVHPDSTIADIEKAAGQKLGMNARHLVRDTLRHVRELHTQPPK